MVFSHLDFFQPSLHSHSLPVCLKSLVIHSSAGPPDLLLPTSPHSLPFLSSIFTPHHFFPFHLDNAGDWWCTGAVVKQVIMGFSSILHCAAGLCVANTSCTSPSPTPLPADTSRKLLGKCVRGHEGEVPADGRHCASSTCFCLWQFFSFMRWNFFSFSSSLPCLSL